MVEAPSGCLVKYILCESCENVNSYSELQKLSQVKAKQKPLFKGSAEEYILEITRIRTMKNAYTEIYIKRD